ncbi:MULTISPECIES: hypothetical protein [Pseudanabaena]|uniref:Uncharacterized protein n=2 Tax=Pseudanabaena TaxID=1152 RepID=L8N175_9CYAN|nr:MULTISPECIES: hypothetical protein [Pseudanabaena]ELS32794.1 hypothetical protein Pse7429DRAFT_1999 [Pseudanabaena biceps PCC 7429]MDG3494981.1 hypothetical protein [Pseudanabaena catenata USMAC16]
MTAMYISLVIFSIGLWWAIKYNQNKQRTVNPPKPKYPTIEDIRRKYPKRLSQEELRRQATAKNDADAKRRQEIIDRNAREARSAKEALRDRQEDHQRKVDAMRAEKAAKRDISVKSFRTLLKMVNGQDAVARRLIEGNLKLFPDKSPDWACDKAIADLERDRRI